MSDNKDLKQAGVEIGHAFKQFGKTFVRSASVTAQKIDNTVNKDNPETADKDNDPNSSVYRDGSWKKTASGLGKAFAGFGKALVNTVADNKVTEEKTEEK